MDVLVRDRERGGWSGAAFLCPPNFYDLNDPILFCALCGFLCSEFSVLLWHYQHLCALCVGPTSCSSAFVLAVYSHTSRITHSGHFGFYEQRRRSGHGAAASDEHPLISSGTTFASSSSTCRTLVPGASPVRFATRKICVSTAIVAPPQRGVQDARWLVCGRHPKLFELLARTWHFSAVLFKKRSHIEITFFAFAL